VRGADDGGSGEEGAKKEQSTPGLSGQQQAAAREPVSGSCQNQAPSAAAGQHIENGCQGHGVRAGPELGGGQREEGASGGEETERARVRVGRWSK